MNEPLPARRAPFTLTAFGTGFLTGLVCLVLGIGVLYALPDPSNVTDRNVSITSSGAALTSHGATRLQIDDERGRSFVQTCNSACDDLQLQMQGGDNGVRVRVLDADGHALLDEGDYVASDVRTRMTVAGQEKLRVDVQRDVGGH